MATKTVRRKTSPWAGRLVQYLALSADEATAKREKTKIRDELIAAVEESHEVDEEKGHLLHIFPEPLAFGAKRYLGFMKQRKVSQVFQDDLAEELCASKGFAEEEYVSYERYVDQDKVARLYAEDRLTEEEFNSLIEENESWAFVPVKE